MWNDNNVIEEEALLDDNFYNWYEENEEKGEELKEADDLLWYYNYGDLNWKRCENSNLIQKYEKSKGE